ncbi:MAG TPA: aminotransferase class V-fold PLP-dependent enzyme [Polyangiaceae bacterium]|nr:aminotransferase class V-fold PLP-dependent enzyme [Polyangiaceae bacterium]
MATAPTLASATPAAPSESPAPLYCDWNATTPPYPEVVAQMAAAAATSWANPSSVHAAGRTARNEVESLRELLASSLSVDARDVLLTSGGTEANNLALHDAAGLVTSRLEHPSVTRVAEALTARGRPVRWLPIPRSGRLDPDALADVAADLPTASWVSIQLANHETGVVQDVAGFAERAHGLGLRLHVDAVQAFGKVPIEALRAADRLTLTAHKLRGPKGIGALAWRGNHSPRPLLVGGSQERGLRPGTVDAVAAVGFRVALELTARNASLWAGVAALRDELEHALVDVAAVNGAGDRLPHVSNLSFDGCQGDELVAALDLVGIQVSSGSACSAGSSEPSAVVAGMLGRDRALRAVRFSLAPNVTSAQVSRIKLEVFRSLGRTQS